MARARFLVPALAGLLLAVAPDGPVAAREIATGQDFRLVREEALPSRLLWFTPVSRGEAVLTSYAGRFRERDRFDVVDETGYTGRIEIVRVERQTRCAGFESLHARFLGGPVTKPWGASTVALGPTRVPALRARVVTPPDMRWLPDRKSDNVTAVDLDGDRLPDLARFVIERCAGGGQPGGGLCVETWARAAGRWALTERSEIPDC